MNADERPDVAATIGDGARVTSAPGFDVDYHLDQVGDPIPGQEINREAGGQPEAVQETGHINPATAARCRQAQTELVGLIRGESRALGQEPEAERQVLPASLADWLAGRVAELEQAEANEPEIEAIG
jgi:hypothetical protein